MRIERTRVLNVDRYLKQLPPKSTFKIIADVDDAALSRAGFDPKCESGTVILPNLVGPTSKFNAEGKFVALTDQPKEERYLYTRHFRRIEWHGQDRQVVEDSRDYTRMCYPRELIPPPGVELTYLEHEGQRLVVSPEFTYVDGSEDANKHAINLMLELFGTVEIVLKDLARLTPPVSKRAHWVMLPPGRDPFDHVAEHVKKVYAGRSPSIVAAVLERQKAILAHEPKEVVRGQAGFSDYVAYLFPDRGLVVLESVHYGNAMYLFGQNWEALSKLTKAEIIQGELAEKRIIHSQGWVGHLADAMRPPKAAE